MSFSGKKFRRVRSENVEKLVKSKNGEHLEFLLKCKAPTFSYTRLDDETFTFEAEVEDRKFSKTFKLGEECMVERLDGSKIKVVHTMEGDNIINKRVEQPNGLIIHLSKEFSENETKMTVKIEGSTVEAKIFYEMVK